MIEKEKQELAEKYVESMSEDAEIMCVDSTTLTKDELLQHIRNWDETGQNYAENVIYWMKRQKERAEGL